MGSRVRGFQGVWVSWGGVQGASRGSGNLVDGGGARV